MQSKVSLLIVENIINIGPSYHEQKKVLEIIFVSMCLVLHCLVRFSVDIPVVKVTFGWYLPQYVLRIIGTFTL